MEKATNACNALRRATVFRYSDFLTTETGHNFAKRLGPIICFNFFLSQAIHVYFYAMVVGPRFREKFEWLEPITSIIYAIGWILCFKVTYLYYRVSLCNAGTPKIDVYKFQKEKPVGNYDQNLPLS